MKNRVAIRGRRKELSEAIRERRSIVKLAEYIDEEFVEDGKVTVHVNVDELYRPMSMGNLRQLNPDIFEYVEHCVSLVPSLIPLRVVFHGVDKEDREKVPELFRLHYDAQLQEHLWDLRMNRLRMMCMGVLGVAFIVAYLYFALAREGTLFLELLSVVGSFALWDAVNCFVVERRTIHKILDETAQFLTAEIDFEDEKTEGGSLCL